MQLASAHEVTKSTAELYLPPRRKLPSEAAALYLRNEKGPWVDDAAPMMVEPMNAIAGRAYNGICVVGPARSSKTFSLIHGGIAYIVVCAPGDTLIVQMSQEAARDFSKTEVDRVIRHSPELQARLSPRPRDDNTFDKFFRSGIVLKLGWPAISQLSSKTLQYVFLTDYDRPENRDNVDGEGPMWDLAYKRIETYMSRGKCIAESSPGEELTDINWQPSSKHEAPGVGGILSIYNRGTRGRWYWPCLHCNHFFEAAPGIGIFGVPDFEACEALVKDNDPLDLAERYARIACPECGTFHEMADRAAMSAAGMWVHEGQYIADGKLCGTRRRSNIASYWFGGCAATYQRWDAILTKYFQGVLNYSRTGDEQQLKTMTSTDLAAPYVSRRVSKRRGVEELKDRLEDWPAETVPKGVRFLTSSVDVQANRFVVSTFGWGVQLELWVIDRFSITMSKRHAGTRPAAVDPGAFVEDWEVLIDEVIRRTYPAQWDPGIIFGTRLSVCDSHGLEGVTARAYEFWRSLRTRAMGNRFVLIRGTGLLNAPRVQQTYPDTRGRKDRHAGSRGDVPVWQLNVNLLKDGVAGDLARAVPGPGYVHIAKWVDPSFFTELGAETRTDKGWIKRAGVRNEQFDLHAYARAACVMLKAETINWNQPPEWAMDPDARQTRAGTKIKDISDIARSLND